MADYPLIIIGGGLSGLAAGIRVARFDQKVLILEQHNKPGGLNSYYYRKGILFETGLHAITNFAPPEEKKAPLNRLLRQLKIPRGKLSIHEQYGSEVLFPGLASMHFTNDFKVLTAEIDRQFPGSIDLFLAFVNKVKEFDPFKPYPRISARTQLMEALRNELLVEMLFCPIMFYGSSEERDMDFSQFVIMFSALFLEGMFRPGHPIKKFLDMLVSHYRSFGGELRLKTRVERILAGTARGRPAVRGVRLENGEEISCDCLLSTIGYLETLALCPEMLSGQPRTAPPQKGRLSFTESIYLLSRKETSHIRNDRTIIFYNHGEKFLYERPDDYVQLRSGVICFPDNFHGLPEKELRQLRITHMANYDLWKEAARSDRGKTYHALKREWTEKSKDVVGKITGNYRENIVYEDSFTPVTIEKFTSKTNGAVYGSPNKIKDGRTGLKNLFIAGTDQGFLGIVGSMLSGVTIVNQQIL